MARNKANVFHGKEYKLKNSISIAEKGAIIVDIANAVFSDNTYAPYMFDVAFKLNCVLYYTDIELPKSADGIDAEKAYELINKSDVMRVLEDIIDFEIYENARELIEYRKNLSLKNTNMDALIGALTSLISNLDEAVAKGIDGIDASELFETAKIISEKNEGELAQGILSFQEEKARKK